jgi:hypothetical protein
MKPINKTPDHLRCGGSQSSCPSLHEIEGDRLLIVGKVAEWEASEAGAAWGANEAPIVFDKALLGKVLAEAIAESENMAIKEIMAWRTAFPNHSIFGETPSEQVEAPSGHLGSEKTPGQIAYEGFSRFKGLAVFWPLGKGYAETEMAAWEAAADALIEECTAVAAQYRRASQNAAEQALLSGDSEEHQAHAGDSSIARYIEEAIRSLKASPQRSSEERSDTTPPLASGSPDTKSSQQVQALSGHLDFEVRAREIAGQLSYPLDDNWRDKPFLCLLVDEAATRNHALIAAALREASERGATAERETCLSAVQDLRDHYLSVSENDERAAACNEAVYAILASAPRQSEEAQRADTAAHLAQEQPDTKEI